MQQGIALALILSLSGCIPEGGVMGAMGLEEGIMGAMSAHSMSSVMASCETPKINDFNSCIQSNYTRNPGSRDVRSLYARLNSIVEDQQNGIISQIKAKALAYAAYDSTVEAGNRADRAARQP